MKETRTYLVLRDANGESYPISDIELKAIKKAWAGIRTSDRIFRITVTTERVEEDVTTK